MPMQEEYDALEKRLADVMAEGGSYRNLQVSLDAALQKHKDDAAAHEASLVTLESRHISEMAQAAAAIRGLTEEHKKAMAEQDGAWRVSSAAALKFQADQHAAEIATLKASVLVPALKDLQARQQADMAAKHAAELAALTK